MNSLVERAIGKVKEIAGEVRNRPDLQHEGALHQEKADAEQQASRRKQEADRVQAEAEATAREKELAAEEARLAAEEAADAGDAQVERDRRADHRQIEGRASEQESLVHQETEAQQAATRRDEISGSLERNEALAEAGRAERQADDARRQAEQIDQGDGQV